MAVYQEKDKNKWTKDGRNWYFRTYYNDIYGLRKQKQSAMFFTKKEAKEAEQKFLENFKKIEQDMTFEKVTMFYLEEYKEKNKESSYGDIKSKIEKHLYPIFKNIFVSKIEIKHFDLLKKQINTLHITTKNSIITYLKSVLQFGADKYDLLIPVLPKIKTIPKGIIPPKKYNVWDINEFNTFINSVDNIMYKALFIVLYFCGLRIGECLALTWNDIDYNIIYINKSCNKKGKKITTPKTSNSYRDIDIPKIVITALNELYLEQSKIYGFNKSWYVFGGLEPLSRTTITRYKDSIINNLPIKRITLHEFRHSHVTLLRQLGYSVKQIANRIGDTETTVIETYSHLFDSNRYEISKGLDNLNYMKIEN